MKRALVFGLLAIVLLTLAACAAGPNQMEDTEDPQGEVAGFWRGLWHGIISPVTFIISLFNQNVGVYEVHNNGTWYDFGFMLGVSIIFGGGGGTGARARRRWR
jgi:hypothetical protein